MAKPITGLNDVFSTWRTNLNIVSENVSDPATITASDGVDSYTSADLVTAINKLINLKVKRSGDSITSLTVTGALEVQGNITLNDAIFVTGKAIKTGTTLGNTMLLQAYDTDGLSYTTMATMTAGVIPTLDLIGSVTVGGNAPYVATGTDVTLADGGTNASLSASNGGIVYSTASAMAILSGTATANKLLVSGSNSAPSWSSATYPASTTQGGILYSSTNNTVTGLTVGSANQMLGVNAAGTLPEYKSLQSTAGSVVITYPSAGVVNLESNTTTGFSIVTTYEKVGQNLFVGSASDGAGNHYNITAGNILEVRPGFGNTATSLIKVESDNAGTNVVFNMNASGDIAIGANKVTMVAASGNTAIAGTLGVSGISSLGTVNAGDLTIGTSKMTVQASTGNTAIAGTLGVTGDVAINTNKFNITASTGNTIIAGTLQAAGISSTSTLGASGTTTLSGALDVTGSNVSTNISPTGTGTVTINPATVGAMNNVAIGATTATTGKFTTATATTLSLSSIADETSVVLNGNTNLNFNLDSFAVATYRTAKYLIQVTQGSNMYVTEVVVTTPDNTNTLISEYAIFTNGTNPVSAITASISGGNMTLAITQANGTATNYKAHRVTLAT